VIKNLKDKRKIADNIYTALCIIGIIAILVYVFLQEHKAYDFSIPYKYAKSWPSVIGLVLFFILGIFGFFSHKVFILRVDFDYRNNPL
jgi:hypothetical protein